MYKIKKIKKGLHNEKIFILIDGWTSFENLFFLIRESIPGNCGYIQYVYPDKILCPDPKKTKENFKHLINEVTNDLKGLKNKKPREFYFYGQSLGGLFCMIVSDKVKTKSVMLVVPGYNLAEAFWYGEGTVDLKNEMIKNHKMTLEKLKNQWKIISPDYYFNKNTETEFNIILSLNDKVIPISNGKKLIKFLKEENMKFHISWTHLTHKEEVIREAIFPIKFHEWIKGLNK